MVDLVWKTMFDVLFLNDLGRNCAQAKKQCNCQSERLNTVLDSFYYYF